MLIHRANSTTILLYAPITAPRCNVKLHRSSIPYMGYLIAAEEGEKKKVYSFLTPLAINDLSSLIINGLA